MGRVKVCYLHLYPRRLLAQQRVYLVPKLRSRLFLDRPLWEVARSAAELLASGRPGRVRECPGVDGCGWLFYDESKNARRRWCSMEGCGNRAKARSYQARRKGEDPNPPSRT